ncbi:hypothetical protein [Tahibacter caeni]|uniref:hypothetical protein n=1 Tax=Tahibacter caeni TaxID=1453545 RepID=UPI0021476696|nr:hypothetical protein [Tahibacter caeni]
MTTLLVLTTGRTDVQLVADAARQELDYGTFGELYDRITQCAWSIVDAPQTKLDKCARELPRDDLAVCTPKLDAVLKKLDGTPIAAALILETHRTTGRDPRFAGAVLARRCEERGIAVRRCAFLEGAETLEDRAVEADAVIRRTVVDRLARAIAGAMEATKPSLVVVAATGGLPEANEVIVALVRLQAPSRTQVTSLKVPDGAHSGGGDRAVEERFHPAAGYRARRRALSLIEKGNLLGAWGAVSHLENEREQEWTQVVRWLARFASSQPNPDCELAVLRHPRMAVRAALRVELALRAGDIPRAVHGTVAFFETAFWDWIRQRDFRRDDGAFGDAGNGFTFASPLQGERKARFRKPNEKEREKKGNVWFVNDFATGLEAWLPVLDKPALQRLWDALKDDIRSLRNDVAHNEPTPELMTDARRRMQASSLWSAGDTFLSQSLIGDVLIELGVSEPSALLERLQTEVRRRLVATAAAATPG